MKLPYSFDRLVNSLMIFPGVGEKTAERFTYSLIDKDIDTVEELSRAILEFKKTIKNCEICGCLSDDSICEICKDETRDKKIICVVEDSKNIFAIEKTKKYKGLYHSLNGLISPLNDKNPEDLNIGALIKDRINNNVEEVIIAINPSIEGEITSLYIKKLLDGKPIKVSRLSYGIPIGSDFEYLDPLMISKALDDRKQIS